ncbi:hypothetical protein ACYSNU_01740 [Enterococcus sp. LJL120]
MNDVLELLNIFGLLILGLAAFGTVLFELRKRRVYQNDERWQLIVSKGNQITYGAASILATFVLIVLLCSDFGFFKRISFFELAFQKESLFQFLYFMGIVTPYLLIGTRISSLFILDKKM